MELNVYVYFTRTTSCPYLTLGMLGINPCLNEDCASFGICFPSTIIEIVLFLHFLNNHSVATQRKALFLNIFIIFFWGGGGGEGIHIKVSFGNNLWVESYQNAYCPTHTHSFHVFFFIVSGLYSQNISLIAYTYIYIYIYMGYVEVSFGKTSEELPKSKPDRLTSHGGTGS